MIEET